MPIDQAYLSFKKDIEFIDKYDVETQWKSIYELIHDVFLC